MNSNLGVTTDAAFHRNRVNQYIHMVCVWPILWTALIVVAVYTLPAKNSGLAQGAAHVSGATLLAGLFALFYVLFDSRCGTLCAVLVLGGSVVANHLAHTTEPRQLLIMAAAVHVLCWVLQFIGHGVYEKRRPALLDNALQAFLMAPFFVTFEMLLPFGYEPSPGFHQRTNTQIGAILKRLNTKSRRA